MPDRQPVKIGGRLYFNGEVCQYQGTTTEGSIKLKPVSSSSLNTVATNVLVKGRLAVAGDEVLIYTSAGFRRGTLVSLSDRDTATVKVAGRTFSAPASYIRTTTMFGVDSRVVVRFDGGTPVYGTVMRTNGEMRVVHLDDGSKSTLAVSALLANNRVYPGAVVKLANGKTGFVESVFADSQSGKSTATIRTGPQPNEVRTAPTQHLHPLEDDPTADLEWRTR